MQNLLSSATATVYHKGLKPVLFLFDPELIHNHFVSSGKFLGAVPVLKHLVKYFWCYEDRRLGKTLNGITFPNPVGLSAGFDYNADLTGILPAVGFGFQTVGTVTLRPYAGNHPPRLERFPRSQSLLVNKGLKNIGAREIIKKLTDKHFAVPTGISIASTNRHYRSEAAQIKDMTECFRLLEAAPLHHAYYELNISCPNTFGGEPFTSPSKLTRLLKKMDQLHLIRPLYVKMPIDQSLAETLKLLKVLAAHKVQGVIFGNLTKDRKNPAVNWRDRVLWQQKKGNLSGKPTWQRSNDLIELTRKHYKSRFTIIGTGGIFSGADAATKLKLGADLVQLITGMIYQGPQLIGQINAYLASQRRR